MPETFLLLLCAGVMLASAIPAPPDAALRWLRLGGIISLTMFGLSLFFWTRRGNFERTILGGYIIVGIGILVQLALVQTAKPVAARIPAILATVAGVALSPWILGRSEAVPIAASIVGCAGVAAMCGIILMEMLLGHAYRTEAKMTMAPFRRMNNVLIAVLMLRMFFALCAILMEPRWRVELFWTRDGLLVGMRWLVGLLAPCVLVYMIHNCIKRRSTRSATGILYLAGVVVFIGEIIALYLTRETGLPF